jgi:hypothetical protein
MNKLRANVAEQHKEEHPMVSGNKYFLFSQLMRLSISQNFVGGHLWIFAFWKGYLSDTLSNNVS